MSSFAKSGLPSFGRERPTLSGLFDVRRSLRQQEVALLAAIHDVQAEVRSWQHYRRGLEAQGQRPARELCLLWEELVERERALCLDLLQVRAAHTAANRDIQARLSVPPFAS